MEKCLTIDSFLFIHSVLPKCKVRSFDIQGGGGAWVFGPGRKNILEQNRSKIVFSPALWAGIFFFITESYNYEI